MNIIQKKIEEIYPYKNNPRKNEIAVEAVANSIKEFGFKVPIIIDKSSVIVCGHTRYKAALKLGLVELPCVVADDLSEEQIKAYRLADNKVSELAEWDEEKLLAELKALDSDIDMSMFNFDLEALSVLEEKEIIEDDFCENNIKKRVKLGDIWGLGRHRIMCADSTILENIEALQVPKGGGRYDSN